MSQDLFESLLPPIKSNYEPKVDTQPIKEESPIPETIDYGKIWDDIDSGNEHNQSNEVRSSMSGIQPGRVVILNNKRKTPPHMDSLSTPQAKSMKLTPGDESRRIFQTVFQHRNSSILAANPQSHNVVVSSNLAPETETHEEEEEGRTNTEIYAQYHPAKLKRGRMHPYPVVESSSLSSVEVPNIRYKLKMPDEIITDERLSNVQLESVVYACQRHEEILPSNERAGFLIGDGAGVGKGRILAAIIFENYLHHRKRALWVSVSNDLRHDAERDLRDLGANEMISVYSLNKLKYAKINSPENGNIKKGVLYSTYASLIGECQGINASNSSKNIAAGGKYKSRFKQIVQWFGSDYDGVIVFDECHKAKNLMPQGSQKKTKTAEVVLKLQEALPQARVVYASATGASEPRNMAYMTRLGLWGKGTPFPKFEDFVEKLEDRVGAMELLAVDMKQRGMYLARQLSFADVTFRVHEVTLENVKLGDYRFLDVYDEAVLLWRKLHEKTCESLRLLSEPNNSNTMNATKWSKTIWGQYWAAHQRFFKYLVMAGKVQECVKITLDAISRRKCVVIGLQSTGEAKTQEMLNLQGTGEDGEHDEFVSCARGILQTFVERFFPTRENIRQMELQQQRLSAGGSGINGGNRRKNNKSSGGGGISLQDALSKEFLEKVVESEHNGNSSDDYGEYVGDSDSDDDSDDSYYTSKRGAGSSTSNTGNAMSLLFDDVVDDYDDNESNSGGRRRDGGAKAKASQLDLLEDVRRLAPKLPINTLDALIRELGGTDYVAEMTGRKGRMVMNTITGIVSYESRREQDVTMEQVNLVERERFNRCEKLVAIISDAASTGISLHADRRYANNLQRVHITLELPWSADRAIQQFGRTHRSNQSEPPKYVFLISNLAGERRFASTVAKRLESLGALTHGDRRAAETRDLSQFNIDNKFGRNALDNLFELIYRGKGNIVPIPQTLLSAFSGPGGPSGTVLTGFVLKHLQDELHAVGLLPKDSKNVSKFLNRILGMTLQVQNGLFQFYTDTMDELVSQAKRNQEFDRGIIDLAKENDNIFVEESRDFCMQFLGDDIKVQLHRVKSITGMSWTTAKEMLAKARLRKNSKHDGFYENKSSVNKKIVLAIRQENDNEDKNTIVRYALYSPNNGELTSRLDQGLLLATYSALPDPGQKNYDADKSNNKNANRAETLWTKIYGVTERHCLHYYWNNACSSPNCDTGCRTKVRNVLSGSIFYIWDIISHMIKSPQLTRVRLNDGKKIIGCLISHMYKDKIVEILSRRGKDSIPNTSQNNSTTNVTSTATIISSTSANTLNQPLSFSQSPHAINLLTTSRSTTPQPHNKQQLQPFYVLPSTPNSNQTTTRLLTPITHPQRIFRAPTIQHSNSMPLMISRQPGTYALQQQSQNVTPAQVKIVSLQSNNVSAATPPALRVSAISRSNNPLQSNHVRLVPAQSIRSSTVPRLVPSSSNITHVFNTPNHNNNNNQNNNSIYDEVIEID